MAMTKGQVTIDSGTGAPSGGGAARAMFDALDATVSYQGQTGEGLAVARQPVADICNAVAEMIDYIIDNAEVGTSGTGTASDIVAGGDDADVAVNSTGTIT